MDGNSDTNAFPNATGHSADSLALIRDEMGGQMDWAQSYRYVPGLHRDDPGDLILMYLVQPTRWTWHGPPPTVFTPKAWIVVPLDFTMSGPLAAGRGELSERVSLDMFRSRLRRTLDFIRTNERPSWQTVVAEHTRFLDCIEHVDQ